MASRRSIAKRQRKLSLMIQESNELARAELRIENNLTAAKILFALVRNLMVEGFPAVLVPAAEIEPDVHLGGEHYKAIEKACGILAASTIKKGEC